jgi:hypothetical protein
MMSAKRHTKTVCRGLFLRVVCRHDMPFLEKIADITMSGRHVADMSATFPAKLGNKIRPLLQLYLKQACVDLLPTTY